MNFVNYTPFSAQAFQGVDQENRVFHVVVLRQTLSFADGALAYADVQEPLCEGDEDRTDGRGVRQESDLCPYKPRCDIIANATAYAPRGTPRTAFIVRLTVRKPDKAALPVQRPQGAGKIADASATEAARRHAQVELSDQKFLPGVALVDKSLWISGERQFTRKNLLVRTLQWIVRLGSLGLLRPTPWQLTHPTNVSSLSINDGYAFGGECRINSGDAAARRLRAKHRLTPAALAMHPDHDAAPPRKPVRHTVCHANHRGSGFIDLIHLKATKTRIAKAPQIEHRDAKLDARQFWQALHDRLPDGEHEENAAFQPAGFGVKPKSHPLRRKLAGIVDHTFSTSDRALPDGFDFAFWNAAPNDQQTSFLRNDETIELVNLCPPATPGTERDTDGNLTMRLTLLAHECFVLCRKIDGTLFRQPLVIDTVSIEPDKHAVEIVWRSAIDIDPSSPIRACEARMHSHLDRDQMAQGLADMAGAASDQPGPVLVPEVAPE